MRIKSALLALIAGAAIVAGACGSATEPVASGEARFPEGSYCAEALALGEDVTGTLLWKVCDAGKIVMATDPAYPPYSSIDASGEYVGFDSDTSREVAKRLGVEVEWATPDWSAITAGNWGGRWDISIGSMTQTEERALVVDFADPYFYESGYLLVPTASTAATVADLAGATICAGESTTHSTWIEGGFADSSVVVQYNAQPEGAKLKTYPTDFNCIEAYLAGRTNDWDAMAQSREFIEAAIAVLGRQVAPARLQHAKQHRRNRAHPRAGDDPALRPFEIVDLRGQDRGIRMPFAGIAVAGLLGINHVKRIGIARGIDHRRLKRRDEGFGGALGPTCAAHEALGRYHLRSL